MTKVFHDLVSPANAKKTLTSEIGKMLQEQQISIQSSCGLVLAGDVLSSSDIPPFDRSEVDGYAVSWESLIGAEEDSPISLKNIGEVQIGTKSYFEVRKGECAYVPTGGIIPRGADSVVMVEYSSRMGDEVRIYRGIAPGENIAHTGSDFFYGEVLARSNRKITPEMVALFSSSGISRVKAYRKMRIGIFSTGDELIEPGEPISEGKIYDSNSYFFKAAIETLDQVSVELLGRIKDDERETASFLKTNSGNFDILMSSGSTSAGFHDLLYRTVEDLGGNIIFHGISIKPGKPTFLAKFNDTLLIGMPGFPLSAAVVLYYIVLPAFRTVLNLHSVKEKTVKVPFKINSEKGKVMIIPAIIGRTGRGYPIYGESGSISRMAYADGMMIFPGKKNYYERDERVRYIQLKQEKRDLLCIGSNDPLLERVIYESSSNPTIVNAGSWGGVRAIEIGESDVSGIHLLKEGQYNRFVMNPKLREKSVLIRGFSRRQGIISGSGVASIKEIVQKNLLFVNRNRGSGTRDLIDFYMDKELGKEFQKENIRGYFWEAKSHAAVAQAVKQGRADAGVSIELYSKLLDLEFVPLKEENYDILVSRNFLMTSNGRKFIDNLKSSSKYIDSFPGYSIPGDIGNEI